MLRLCTLTYRCSYQINTIHDTRQCIFVHDLNNVIFLSVDHFALINKIVNIKQRKSFIILQHKSNNQAWCIFHTLNYYMSSISFINVQSIYRFIFGICKKQRTDCHTVIVKTILHKTDLGIFSLFINFFHEDIPCNFILNMSGHIFC